VASLPDIRKTIVLNAPIGKVWEAVATSEGIAGWWMDNTLEPLLGNEFVLHTEHFGDSPCVVTELEPPVRFGFNWSDDWHITFELKALEGGKTEFILIHAGWDPDKVTAFGQPHAKVRDIMDGGWEKIVKDDLPAFINTYVNA